METEFERNESSLMRKLYPRILHKNGTTIIFSAYGTKIQGGKALSNQLFPHKPRLSHAKLQKNAN